jgi:hypothetical protein
MSQSPVVPNRLHIASNMARSASGSSQSTAPREKPVSTSRADLHPQPSLEPLEPLDEFNTITTLWNGFRRNNPPSALQDGLATFLMAPFDLINNLTLRELDITRLVYQLDIPSPFKANAPYMHSQLGVLEPKHPQDLQHAVSPHSDSEQKTISPREALLDYEPAAHDLALFGSSSSSRATKICPSLDSWSRRQWEIPGRIGGILTAAFPDSGSSRDTVSHDFVKKHFSNHAINFKSVCDIKIPNGTMVQSLGELQLPFQFEGESMAHIRSFAVLKTCVHDVVLGKTFLRITKTLTQFRNRLREKIIRCFGSRRIHLMGNPDEILGQVGGYLTSACPDTGSDIMAISSHFCQQRGYIIDDSEEHKIKVQFADGSFGWTQGKVSGLDWRFGHDQSLSDSFLVDFYVLQNLPCDVILSNEFLFDNNVFNRFEEFFVRGEMDEDGPDSFYLIQRIGESLMSRVNKILKRKLPLGMQSSSQVTYTKLTGFFSGCKTSNTFNSRDGRRRDASTSASRRSDKKSSTEQKADCKGRRRQSQKTV